MSPLVWTLIDCERLVHFQKRIWIFCYKLSVLIFYHKQAATRLDDSFQLAVCFFCFLWTGTTLAFFHSMGNFPLSMHDLKISSKGFKIESPQIFNMRILIMSKPWALFGLRFLMILAMLFSVNETVERMLFILLKESIGSLLIFSTSVHCVAKKLLKIWAFSLKSVI